MIRHTIHFTGRVQGVGFRYRTENIAMSHEVTGWVRNEPDGSVCCVAEGTPEALQSFVAAIRQTMAAYIREVKIEPSPATGEFDGFRIRK